MSQAIITRPAQTQILATMTRVQFSGMDSWFAAAPPAASDCVLKARSMVWDFGDQTTQIYGWHVSHKFALAGTYVVLLTVTWADGSISTAQVNVTVAAMPSFSTFTKYIDPSMPNDNGNGDTPATAYKTLERAFSVWRSQPFRTQWGVIFCKKGVPIPFVGLEDGTHTKTCDYGPLFITSFGTGTRPVLAITAGIEIDIDEGHDSSWDRPVFLDGVDLTWSARSSGYFSSSHRGCQIENSIFTNGQMLVRGDGSGFFNFQVLNSNGTNFVAANYVDFDTCTFKGNGDSGEGSPTAFDHQVYSSTGTKYGAWRGCTFDATGTLGAYAGLKTSGSRKVYVVNPVMIGNDNAFDIGSNPDNQNTQDLVIENPVLNGIQRFGFYANAMDRVSIRNPIVYGGCSDSVLRLQPYNAGQIITDLQMYGGSFYKPTGAIVYNATVPPVGQTWLVRIEVFNNAEHKAVASGPFMKAESGTSLFGCSFQTNQYYRDGGSAGETGFVIDGATTYSFTSWRATGSDFNSQYGDPLFTGANDLHLQIGSPCVDKGSALGVLGLDAYGKVRPFGVTYDIGADESVGGIGPGFMTFRQYPADMDVTVTELGFESQAAASACVAAALLDSPVCPLNGLPWVFPGFDDSLPNHIFVFKFKRWERGLTLWYITCGKDDETEAHETGIPGYAMALGYDTTLQGLMTKYSNDVGDPLNSSKATHYEICWKRKQDAAAPPAAPPAPLNPIFTETTTNGMTSRVQGTQNQVQLAPPIYSETKTLPTDLSGNPPVVPPPPPPIFAESLVGIVVPFIGPTTNVSLLKIFSRSAVNTIQNTTSPADGRINLAPISSESFTIQLDYTVQGGDSGFNLLLIHSESLTLNPEAKNDGGSNPAGLQKIWSETLLTVPDILVIGAIFHRNLDPISSEAFADSVGYSVGGGNQQAFPLQPIFSESTVNAPSTSQGGIIYVNLLASFSESFLGDLERTENNPGIYNLVSISSEAFVTQMHHAPIATPQAISIGDFSGGVELEGEF